MLQLKNMRQAFISKDLLRFFKNVFALVSGTALAQVVNFFFMPIITRLYGPEAYGGLGYYASFISFIVPLVGLCYPLAIVLPKSEGEARAVAELSVKISIATIGLVLIAILLNKYFALITLPFSFAVLFLVLGSVTSFLIVILSQFCIRKKEFKKLSFVLVSIALIGGVAKISFGNILPTAEALISITIAIGILQCFSLGYISRVNFFKSFSFSLRKRHWVLLKRLKRFPAYRLPHTTVATLSQLMPVFLLTSFFGVKAAGYFVLTRSALAIPVTLIGKAIHDVAYPTINQRKNGNKGNYEFVSKLTFMLMILAILPLVFFILYGEYIFSLVFGDDWRMSGVYASWMAVWFAFNLFNKACAASVSVYHLDSFLFFNGLLNLALCSAGFFVGYFVFDSDVIAIALFSLLGIVCQIILITKVLLFIRQSDRLINR